MKSSMYNPKIPQTDSIQELAEFWDTHDVPDFEDQLEKVTAPVFEKSSTINVPLRTEEAEAVQKSAKSKGVSSADLIHKWVLEKIKLN